MVDLSGAWSTFWNAITSSIGPQLTNVLSVLGVAIPVFNLAMYFWQRARNKSGDQGRLQRDRNFPLGVAHVHNNYHAQVVVCRDQTGNHADDRERNEFGLQRGLEHEELTHKTTCRRDTGQREHEECHCQSHQWPGFA